MLEIIPPNEYSWPRLSPDGDRVLVLADGDARIYDLASGRESRLTTDGATGYVGWTPSGAEVTYSSIRGPEGAQVWIQPADGSGAARQLTALDGPVHFDAWAPDARTFSAHHHVGGTTNQLMVAFDGENAEPETWLEHEHSDNTAVFSPDGRYVAHVCSQTGQNEIYIRPFPGPGGQTTVSVGGGMEPAWAPTGELFYRRPSDYMSSDAPTMQKNLTREEAIIGTLQYMAPEQLERKPVDARTDIFAFGNLLYEMLSGKKTFDADSQAGLIANIVHVDLPALAKVPPALDRTVKKCLAKDPDARWQSARDLVDELGWIAKGAVDVAETMSQTSRPRHERLWKAAAVVSALALFALALVHFTETPPSMLLVTFDVQPPAGGTFSRSNAFQALSPDGTRLVWVFRGIVNADSIRR